MRSTARCYDDLRAFCERVPLVDCHDHSGECGPRFADPIQVVVSGYFRSDILSASSDADLALLDDLSKPLEERWPLLERAWRRTCHTGYALVTRRMLKRFYDCDDLSLDALRSIGERMIDWTDRKTFDDALEEAKIAVRLVNVEVDTGRVLDGTAELSPRARLVIPLPGYHSIRDYGGVQSLAAPLGRRVTSLGEYLDACREIFAGYKRFGAVAFKDQSAYTRPIDYGNPSRAAAEEVFNGFMADQRRSAGYPEAVRPLDDYLFHEFLRMARDLDLPVQIHTGHMAGIRNDVAKTNAAGLVSVLELHPDVRFDLFHANWPYSGDLLFLGKNFPNVTLDFCWANIIDPVYCRRMFQQAVSSVPHGKIHGYGSDFGGSPDRAWAHASIARDNIAMALADLVETEYLDLDAAREIARAWLFDNANDFFRLGVSGPQPRSPGRGADPRRC